MPAEQRDPLHRAPLVFETEHAQHSIMWGTVEPVARPLHMRAHPAVKEATLRAATPSLASRLCMRWLERRGYVIATKDARSRLVQFKITR